MRRGRQRRAVPRAQACSQSVTKKHLVTGASTSVPRPSTLHSPLSVINCPCPPPSWSWRRDAYGISKAQQGWDRHTMMKRPRLERNRNEIPTCVRPWRRCEAAFGRGGGARLKCERCKRGQTFARPHADAQPAMRGDIVAGDIALHRHMPNKTKCSCPRREHLQGTLAARYAGFSCRDALRSSAVADECCANKRRLKFAKSSWLKPASACCGCCTLL